MKNVMIHGILSNRCPVCIAPPNEFGDLPDTPYDTQQHSWYATAYYKSNLQVLESEGVKRINNALWHISNCEPHTLVRMDTLHTILLGMLTHLMKWIQEFLDHIRTSYMFNHIWSRSVSQWQSKEMHNLLWVLLAVFTATLSRRSDTLAIETRHKASYHKAILCVRYLTDFILIAQYKLHPSRTI
ncbi:hypothetical protein BGX38DRAFT_1227804, partial [Terfezia claveryi]